MPTIEGAVEVSLDWGRVLALESTTLDIKTGASWASHAIAWVSITVLLAICLVRVPIKTE